MEGKVTKGIGGFYYVSAGERLYECKARKKVKSGQGTIVTGDNVIFHAEGTGSCTIERILPRRNALVRPPVSNVDQVMIVFSVDAPRPNFLFLDKLILNCEMEHLQIFLCCNKVDMKESNLLSIRDHFRNTGYDIIFSSAKRHENVHLIKQKLAGRTTVLAGPSGVGKSSLINALEPDLDLETGAISAKLKRGKHTTRHTELLKTDTGGYVLDTPGFTSLDIGKLSREEVRLHYPDFMRFGARCKFNNCLHLQEPGCAVKKAVEAGDLSPERYANYKLILDELRENRRF